MDSGIDPGSAKDSTEMVEKKWIDKLSEAAFYARIGEFHELLETRRFEISMVLKRQAEIYVTVEDEWIDSRGFTPLHWAALNNHESIVEHLIKKCHLNPGIKSTDSLKSTPLHWACNNNCVEVILRFLSNKDQIDVNAKDSKGYTPLHIASQHNNYAAAHLLIAKGGAKVNEMDGSGDTPLHWTCARGYTDTMRCLLCFGADPLLKDLSGRNCLDTAAANGRKKACVGLMNAVIEKKAENSGALATLLNNAGDSASERGFTGLGILIRSGNLHLAGKRLLNSGIITLIWSGILVPYGFAYFFYPIRFSLRELIIHVVLYIATHYVLLLLLYRDPGEIKKRKNFCEFEKRDWSNLANGRPICYHCKIYYAKEDMPYPVHHCRSCNKCVGRFDHHCSWVSNCIGSGNSGLFLILLVLELLYLGYSLFLLLSVMLYHERVGFPSIPLEVISEHLVGVLLALSISWILQSIYIHVEFAVMSMLLIIFFFFVFALIQQQLILKFRGQTAYSMISKQRFQ